MLFVVALGWILLAAGTGLVLPSFLTGGAAFNGGCGQIHREHHGDRWTILKSGLKIDFSRRLLDTEICEAFSEVIVTGKNHPYVLGVCVPSRIVGFLSERQGLEMIRN